MAELMGEKQETRHEELRWNKVWRRAGKSVSLIIYHHQVHVVVITGFSDCAISTVY